MNVQLFIPCFVDQLYPQVAFNMVKVLEKTGCTVSYNTAQTCCGQPAFNAGFWGEAKEVCNKFLNDFRAHLVSFSPHNWYFSSEKYSLWTYLKKYLRLEGFFSMAKFFKK